MALKCGDIAPNPSVMTPRGLQPLLHQSRSKEVILRLGPNEDSHPEAWRELLEYLHRDPDRFRFLRVLPEGLPEEDSTFIDQEWETHRRYDAYDWSSHRPLAQLLWISPSGALRFVAEGASVDPRKLLEVLQRRS